jgi:hypothetical protein
MCCAYLCEKEGLPGSLVSLIQTNVCTLGLPEFAVCVSRKPGACGSKAVKVRVLSSAPTCKKQKAPTFSPRRVGGRPDTALFLCTVYGSLNDS